MRAIGSIAMRRLSPRSLECEAMFARECSQQLAVLNLVVLCRDAAPSDVQFLTDEDLAEIGVTHQ